MNPEVTVLIVTWNGRELLPACLASVAAQAGVAAQIVVVDNGSDDDTLAWLAQAHPEVEPVALPFNAGFAAGCNAGLERVRARWVLTLNNDAVLGPGSLRLLLEAAHCAQEHAFAFQPQLRFLGRPRLNSTGILLRRDGCAHDRDFDRPVELGSSGGEVWCATAGAALYRVSGLQSLRASSGVFDERFYMYFEDVDLGWRARLAGHHALYVPQAIVEHAFQASSRRREPGFVESQCKRNRLRTLLKNGSLRLLARSLPRTLSDARWLLKHGGGTALALWAQAACDGVHGRWEGRARATVAREAMEARWLEPAGSAGGL